MQPASPGAPVGIGEHEHFKFRRQLLYGNPQIIHLFAATARASRDDHMDFHSRTLGYPFDDAARGIGIGSQNDENLVILPNEVRKRQDVVFQSSIDALAGA